MSRFKHPEAGLIGSQPHQCLAVATPLGDKHTRAASARREATRPCRGTMGDTRGLVMRERCRANVPGPSPLVVGGLAPWLSWLALVQL